MKSELNTSQGKFEIVKITKSSFLQTFIIDSKQNYKIHIFLAWNTVFKLKNSKDVVPSKNNWKQEDWLIDWLTFSCKYFMHIQDDNKIGKKKNSSEGHQKFKIWNVKKKKSLIFFCAEIKDYPTKYNYQEI